MWPFTKRRQPKRTRERWDLSTPLLRWTRDDVWTIRDALEGTLVLGATGSSKSSGSGRTIALAMLNAGFGGVVLTAKADERANWESYCREAGRSDDLMIFGADEKLRFNFMDFELQRGGGASHTENLVQLLSTVLEVAERNSGQGREDEGYWKKSLRQLCRNLVDLLVLAKGRVSVSELYALLVSAPGSMEQVRSDEWRKRSLLFQALAEADSRLKTDREQRDFSLVADFFLLEWPKLSDRTRSVIVSTFTSMIDVLNRGLLHDLFCTETNVTPKVVEDGKVIVLDLPVKEYAEVGLLAQVILKYTFQRSIERRNVAENPRAVFLWADEAQHFVTSYDMQFQTTCRAARVATVLLSQNVSNFYAALGGNDKGRAEVDSLFANLNTKIFHANGDAVTNEWAANLIGRTRQTMASGNSSYAADDEWSASLGLGWMMKSGTTSAGFSETFEYQVQPSAFTRLKTGGPSNGFRAESILFQNGRVFNQSGRTWLRVIFQQRA